MRILFLNILLTSFLKSMEKYRYMEAVKHLIFAASKYCNCKRLIYWRCLILAITEFNDL